jgi:tRNA A37 N6-isopentenylltransferase MiaA
MNQLVRKPKVIFIAGPTGVGKSDVAFHVAQKINTDIIVGDSLQVIILRLGK